ncbi:PTS sugar transporter subunit IIA [Anaerorhabdus sp.]|uniref:PTS sugar transporter subunit IIA n=1 Tax=Anaerorhabdus sp. TaxID=1872524 RepID=UPI002FC7039D
MNRYIVIASHGPFAKGAYESLKMFFSSLNNCKYFTAYVEDYNFEKEVDTFLESITSDDELIVFTDLLGGSVNTQLLPLTNRDHTHIISGFNFPLLVSTLVLSSEEYLSPVDIQLLIDEAKSGICYVNILADDFNCDE